MTREGVQSANTPETVYLYVLTSSFNGKSLRQLAREYGDPVTHMDIRRILNKKKFPSGLEKRRALGLPDLIPTEPCTKCGEVHNIDRACEMIVTVRPKPQPVNQERAAYKRQRRAALNAVAQKKGFKSWYAYGTAMLEEEKI